MPFRVPVRYLRVCLAACAVAIAPAALRAQAPAYVNFESQQTRPICLSPDGSRLFAVNTPDGRLSVFDVSNAANPVPVLIREITVGVEPVSVNALTGDQAWVANEVSDSVSVVSVATGSVVATLPCPDEPADVVFANGRAFVSCARNNLVRVFDLSTFAEITTIPLLGLDPRSLAVSNDGSKVYAAFKLSGNRTTLLPPNLAPPQPPPTNVSLPPPPQVGLIVSADDSRLVPQPNMPDHDVAEIDAATLAVSRYFDGVGTVNFCVAARPGSDELWVANTDARNLVRFEPALRGHLVDNRVSRVNTITPAVTPFDLNPGVNYALFPNAAALSTALAQPTALAFTPDGAEFWVAAFGTDRVARVSASTGAVLSRIETGPTTGTASDPRHKRGTRGLALHTGNARLYILNRISNTITIVSTATETIEAEIPTGSFDPTPAVIREGRGFLYDARLSGNGTQSCASCHIDGDRDDLTWDLGDPGGDMQVVSEPNPLGGPPLNLNMHPMKGPMTTQTLRGLVGVGFLHWRGDRANFNAFNHAFDTLLGGADIPGADMNAYRDFVNTMRFQPNPNRNLDNTLPATFPPGDPNAGNPAAGLNTYINEQYQPGLTCNTCHSLPLGTAGLIIPGPILQESQDFKIPQLRNMYMKRFFFRSSTTVSLSGFGFVHDGMDPDIFTFLSRPVFGVFANDTTRKRNLNALLQCFDTGMAPAVGHTLGAHPANLAGIGANWSVLEAQALTGNCDLVIRLLAGGKRRGFLYRPGTNDYISDRAAEPPVSRTALQDMITAGAAGFIMGAPPGSGMRLGIDRDGDSVRDGDEVMPPLVIQFAAGPQLSWPATEAMLVLEYTDTLPTANWQPVLEPRAIGSSDVTVSHPAAAGLDHGFYQLRQP